MAADFSAPSFSLGLDLDFEEEEPSIPNPSNQEEEEEEEDLKSGEDPDRDDLEEPQRPVLKRLRRGPLPSLLPTIPSSFADEGNVNLDDDIEDFSSQEGEDHRCPDRSPSLQSHATCSSSKVFLRYSGVLSSQSTIKFKMPKISQAYKGSAPTSFEASSCKDSFPRLTVSPLRKIHVLDSDSDDPSSSKGNVNSKEVDPSDKKRKGAPFQSIVGNNKKPFQSQNQTESFWKDFSPKENINSATPALDEFCDEYFNSAKDQKVGHGNEGAPSFCSSKVLDPADTVDDFEVPFQQKSSSSKTDHNWNFPHPKPPAHLYFFHDDARIRSLIRERLPHFVPIGAEHHRGTQQFGEDDLDYIGQFCPGDGPSQVRASRKGSERNSKGKQKRPSAANSKEAHPDTGNWVNPRSNASIPKDAGKRRVSAVGSQGGHWFTGQDGRKVYISKNGQELTGQMAYRQYRKENGSGFRKGKKKAAITKETTATKRKRKWK